MSEQFMELEEIKYEIQTSLDQLMKSRAKLKAAYDTQLTIDNTMEEAIDNFTLAITNMKETQNMF